MNNFLMLSQRRNKRGRLIEEGQGERERGREGESAVVEPMFVVELQQI